MFFLFDIFEGSFLFVLPNDFDSFCCFECFLVGSVCLFKDFEGCLL